MKKEIEMKILDNRSTVAASSIACSDSKRPDEGLTDETGLYVDVFDAATGMTKDIVVPSQVPNVVSFIVEHRENPMLFYNHIHQPIFEAYMNRIGLSVPAEGIQSYLSDIKGVLIAVNKYGYKISNTMKNIIGEQVNGW